MVAVFLGIVIGPLGLGLLRLSDRGDPVTLVITSTVVVHGVTSTPLTKLSSRKTK